MLSDYFFQWASVAADRSLRLGFFYVVIVHGKGRCCVLIWCMRGLGELYIYMAIDGVGECWSMVLIFLVALCGCLLRVLSGC